MKAQRWRARRTDNEEDAGGRRLETSSEHNSESTNFITPTNRQYQRNAWLYGKHQFLSLKPNKKTDPWSTNQKPINRPSYKTVKTIVLGAVQSVTSRKEYKGFVQFISNQYQWQHQTNTQDKTQNLGDQRIPSCKNKNASKQGGTYVAC